jgi:hypothetical protein
MVGRVSAIRGGTLPVVIAKTNPAMAGNPMPMGYRSSFQPGGIPASIFGHDARTVSNTANRRTTIFDIISNLR